MLNFIIAAFDIVSAEISVKIPISRGTGVCSYATARENIHLPGYQVFYIRDSWQYDS